ncbi:glycerol-3-phosphate acyltransferase PlsY [Alkalibacillus flavidus]|uniref:Glycerol-3-phosphate acyltransferase n=1 Tax=Alkalibacillus flavidus TaxID=546021 RepID=A0ABV2KRN6_9BACI
MLYGLYSVIAYLFGSFPSALILGKLFYHIDIREQGSGNLGATNAFRVLGVKPGIVVTVLDILKGTIPVVLVVIFAPTLEPLIVGGFAVIGHIFPVFAKFRGGKAVATSGGVLLGVSPLLFAILVGSFFVFLKLFKYVSLASMLVGLVAVVTAVIMQDVPLIIVTCVLAFLVIYRHTDNIKRIKNKTEPKISWF